jgi:folate-dependent phosphoribosylglycinamide formyltransferase PurN
MRVVLLTRYPRVDTPAWKRDLAERLLEDGHELAVVYSRSRFGDQLRAGLKEFGPDLARRYAHLRRGCLDDGSSAPVSLAALARDRGVPVSLHRCLGDRDCLERLRSLNPDLLVLAGADIVPASVLDIPRLGALNGHYGLLPRYRGMNVTEWSIYYDDPVGVSVHYVDAGIDTGDIIACEPVKVAPGDRLEDLRAKHQRACSRLLARACALIAAGEQDVTPQRPADGKQFYRMHPELQKVVEAKLSGGSYRWLGASRAELEEAVTGWRSAASAADRDVTSTAV